MPEPLPRPLRGTALVATAAVTLAAHCPHTPWGYATAPTPTAPPQVFFDSGAPVRAQLEDGQSVTGYLLDSYAPGGQRLVICQNQKDRGAPCQSLEGPGARTVQLTSVQRLRIRYTGTSLGADLGFRLGALVALSHDKDDEGLMIAGMVGGAVVGGAIGSRVTRWLTVAERADGPRLTWVPGIPILFPLPAGRADFVTLCARGDSLPDGRIVAVARWTRSAFYTDIRRAWNVDTTRGRLDRRRTAGVRCRNQSWPSPGPGAAPELEAAALSFTPESGKARIYVYQKDRSTLRDSIEFEVAIDGRNVGRTGNGTYLMAELEPGRHRVSVPAATDSAVAIDAAPDSVYFVKLWHRVGLRGPSFGGIDTMDAITARKVIPSAQMVPPAVPVEALTVERIPSGWQLHNASPAPLNYFIVERGTADLMDAWTPCVGRDCPTVPALSSVRIPETYVLGYAHLGREVLVYWWQAVQERDGSLRPDKVRRLVVQAPGAL